MPVVFALPGYLRPLAGGKSEVELDLEQATVGEALGQLFARFPGARDRVLTEVGSVRQHVNIFLGDENIRYLGGLDTPMPRGARITILPAVSVRPLASRSSRPETSAAPSWNSVIEG